MDNNNKKTVAERVREKRKILEDNLPASVDVMGLEFSVNLQPMKKGDWGECVIEERKIFINQAIDLGHARDTLFHESVHAALGVSGLSHLLEYNLEEAIVRCIEHAFCHVVDVTGLASIEVAEDDD